MLSKTLLFIAHGSRAEKANQEIVALAAELDQQCSGLRVLPCFLELASPLIPEAVDLAVREYESQEIHIFPYFLSAGRHVTLDVPKIIEECKQKYPQVHFVNMPYLGQLPTFRRCLQQLFTDI